MALIDRIKNICITPKTEWPVIAGETTSTSSLMTGYVMPLAAIGAVAGFIGSSLIGRGAIFGFSYKTPMLMGIGIAIFTFVMALVMVLLLLLLLSMLALVPMWLPPCKSHVLNCGAPCIVIATIRSPMLSCSNGRRPVSNS